MDTALLTQAHHLTRLDEQVLNWHRKHFGSNPPDISLIRSKILPFGVANTELPYLVLAWVKLNMIFKRRCLDAISDINLGCIVLFPELEPWWGEAERILMSHGLKICLRYNVRLSPLQLAALYVDRWKEDFVTFKMLYESRAQSRVLILSGMHNDTQDVLCSIRGHWDGSTDKSLRAFWHRRAKNFLALAREGGSKWDTLGLLERMESNHKIPFYWLLSGIHTPSKNEFLSHLAILCKNNVLKHLC